jgi:CubicO group peptidase (beta-lactamase class C family)
MANLEHDIAIDENTVFRIGSTSKQFTGACIVLLEMQGKLSYSDSLDKYFPAFPAYTKEVTIQHLLSHTSGIRDYLSLARLKGLGRDDFYRDSDVESWLVAQQELNFKPGEDDMYSNSGYWLLGQIVKKVSGMDMAAFAEKEIFKPLGMNNTHFHNDHTLVVKNRASGYTPAKEPNTYHISMTTLDMIGDGGIFTSISDIKKWDDAYYNSNVLGPEFWQAMTREGELNNGKKLSYGAGLVVDEYKGLKIHSHGGAFVGFRAELLRFPGHKFTVAVFANRGDADPTSKAYQVADVYLADEIKLKAQSDTNDDSSNTSPAIKDTKPEVKFSNQQMVGTYELRAGRQLLVTAEKGILHVYQLWNHSEYDLEVIDSDSNTYQIGDDETLQFTFVDLKNNKTQAISVSQGSATTWKRVEPVDVSGVDVSEFVGSFYSEELDVIYQLSVVDENLNVTVNNNISAKVTVADIDELLLNNSLAKIFREQGEVKGFLLDAGRVKNIKFLKQ